MGCFNAVLVGGGVMLLLPYLPNGCKPAVFELTISQDVDSLHDFVQITLNLEQFYGKNLLVLNSTLGLSRIIN